MRGRREYKRNHKVFTLRVPEARTLRKVVLSRRTGTTRRPGRNSRTFTEEDSAEGVVGSKFVGGTDIQATDRRRNSRVSVTAWRPWSGYKDR